MNTTFNGYNFGTNSSFLIEVSNENVSKIEKKIINNFKNGFKIIKERDCFEGDVLKMEKNINSFVNIIDLEFQEDSLSKIKNINLTSLKNLVKILIQQNLQILAII